MLTNCSSITCLHVRYALIRAMYCACWHVDVIIHLWMCVDAYHPRQHKLWMLMISGNISYGCL